MELFTYQDAAAFLKDTRAELESAEAANGLMLGICGQLIDHPGRYKIPPCIKTIRDDQGLLLAALMTPPHNLIVYAHREEVALAVDKMATNLLQEGWQIPGVVGPRRIASQVANQLARAADYRPSLYRRMRCYELREVMLPPSTQGRLRPGRPDDLELVTRWTQAFQDQTHTALAAGDARQTAIDRLQNGDIYLWEDEEPLSMAMKTRPTRHGISVSLVYTPPELRRNGYASACVAELSRKLLGQGYQFTALFTDLANPTSNSIYQRIGYRTVCDYDEWVLDAVGE